MQNNFKAYFLCTLQLVLILFSKSNVYALEEIESQSFEYEIQLNIPKTNHLLIYPFSKLARDKVSLTIPLDWAGTDLFISSMEPKPDAFYFDHYWAQNQNLIYFIPTDRDQEIKVNGRIVVEKINLDQLEDISDGYHSATIDQLGGYYLYTQETPMTESADPEIIEIAQQIKGDKTNIAEIIEATYSFVVDRIDYDYLSLDLMSGGTLYKPQSALETLRKGSGICGDYSRLLIALLRAQGIPTRMVVGYVDIDQKDGDVLPLHAWAQVYVPGSSFIDIDPTFGESGLKYISDQDVRHIRLRFSTPENEQSEMASGYFSGFDMPNIFYYLNNLDDFSYYINFTKGDNYSESAESIIQLAPVFISKDDGFINTPMVNIFKYYLMDIVLNPITLFMFQSTLIFGFSYLLFKSFKQLVDKKSKKGRKKP